MSESPVSNCEHCGGEIKRLITGGTGLIFKGTGFYLTDYKNEKKSKDNAPDSSQSKDKSSNRKEKTSNTKNNTSKEITIQKKEKKINE